MINDGRGEITGGATAGRKAGRPSRDEARRLDRLILDRALRSFLAEGFTRTTIEQIAIDCGTTRRSVVRRYPTKEALLLAAADLFREQASRKPGSNGEDASPIELLRQACWDMVRFSTMPDVTAFLRMCAAEVYRIPALAEFALAWDDENARAIEALVARAQRAGAFSGSSAASVATLVIGTMTSNPVNRTLLGDPQFGDLEGVTRYFDDMWSEIAALA